MRCRYFSLQRLIRRIRGPARHYVSGKCFLAVPGNELPGEGGVSLRSASFVSAVTLTSLDLVSMRFTGGAVCGVQGASCQEARTFDDICQKCAA